MIKGFLPYFFKANLGVKWGNCQLNHGAYDGGF